MTRKIGMLMINVALCLWRTDFDFKEWPFGPPQHGIRYRIAWKLYHAGLWLCIKEKP